MNYSAPNIPQHKHRFFSRHGGVSGGKYESLNASLRSQDDTRNIYHNLEIAAETFGKTLTDLNILTQGVSNKAVYISQASRFDITADGAVTDKEGIILAIRTADCAPILFYDAEHQIIGAAHAGWRGALRGIIENTLDLMLSLGAEKNKIAAAVGPCLQQPSFECRQDMLEEFLATDSVYQKFFTTHGNEQWLFDAEKFCIHRLRKYGISNICASGIDTYTDNNYFSYRRYCHQRLISVARDFPTHLSTIIL